MCSVLYYYCEKNIVWENVGVINRLIATNKRLI